MSALYFALHGRWSLRLIALYLVFQCLLQNSSAFAFSKTAIIETRGIFRSMAKGRSGVSGDVKRFGGGRGSLERRPKRTNAGMSPLSSFQSEIRKQRVARILRDELTEIICTADFDSSNYPEDGLLQGLCISSIELNADLSLAKVFITVTGNSVERRQIYVYICKHIGQIRHSLHQRLRSFKRIPIVSFELSDAPSRALLDQVLDEISTSNADNHADNDSDFSGVDNEFEDLDFEEINSIETE